MGASREAHYGMLSEPAILVLIGALVLFTGHYSFSELLVTLRDGSSFSYGLGIMSAFLLFLFTLVETCRVPVDDPRTHLELTMIHEVMILDNSGFDLGLIQLSGVLKFGIFGAIISNFFLFETSSWSSVLIFIATQTVFALLIGFTESFMARLRMSHGPQFVMSLNSLAFLIFIGVLLYLNK
jgi:formate hydrogenlyase subunit 4